MEIKTINPQWKQDKVAKELGYSSPTLQLYRHDKKMQNLYKSNNTKTPQNTSKNLKRNPLQMWTLPLIALRIRKTN